MKKIIILIIGIIIHFQMVYGKEQEYQFTDFQQAVESSEYLRFIVESTKIGLFSSDVPGHARSFRFSYKPENNFTILRDLEITIVVNSLDTDHEERDEKLHNYCLSSEQYPTIKVTIPGPVFLNGVRSDILMGEVLIRGKKHPIKVEIQKNIDEGKNISLKTTSTWGLKELGIPDPSIAVAKLSNEIRIEANVIIKK